MISVSKYYYELPHLLTNTVLLIEDTTKKFHHFVTVKMEARVLLGLYLSYGTKLLYYKI